MELERNITVTRYGFQHWHYDEDLVEADEEVLAVDQPAIPKVTILKAQKQDQIVGRVLASKLEGQRPTLQDTKRELPGTKTLSRQWRKLKIGRDGLLRRESGPFKQLVLPSKFHRTIFKERHQDMGHLGAKRVVQLLENASIGLTWRKTLPTLWPMFANV